MTRSLSILCTGHGDVPFVWPGVCLTKAVGGEENTVGGRMNTGAFCRLAAAADSPGTQL